jgi:catechol 2,3-dioxygenase-like lactoylglutathione lyase family enzyme
VTSGGAFSGQGGSLRGLYHVGFLVHDLDAAMDRYEDVLGLDFAEPKVFPLDGSLAEPSSGDRPLRFTYSVQGPMHVELIETQSDGVWGRQHGEGFHHIGMWRTGVDGWLEEHVAGGEAPQAVMRGADGVSALYMPPEFLHNVRLELIAPAASILPAPTDVRKR